MSLRLTGSIKLRHANGNTAIFEGEDFYHADGGGNGSSYLFRNDEEDIMLLLNINVGNGIVQVIRATWDGEEAEVIEDNLALDSECIGYDADDL